MFTILTLTTIGIWWDMVKIGGKAAAWVLKWMFIITVIAGIIIPALLSIFLTMCCISFAIWLVDFVLAKIMKRDRKIDRSPFDFSTNWKRLAGATGNFGERMEKRQNAGNNDIYAVRGKDLAKVKKVEQKNRPITLDEIILYDVIVDD